MFNNHECYQHWSILTARKHEENKEDTHKGRQQFIHWTAEEMCNAYLSGLQHLMREHKNLKKILYTQKHFIPSL